MDSPFLAVLVWLCLASLSCGESQLRISATASDLIVRVEEPADCPLQLIEWPAHTLPKDDETGCIVWEGTIAADGIRLPRRWEGRDRLFSRFELRAKSASSKGSVAWVTDVSAAGARDFAFPKKTSKKGINCLVSVPDAKELGLQHANANINMRALLDASAGTSEHNTIVDGKEIPLNPHYVRHLDNYIGEMTAAGISVTGILLNYFDPQKPRDVLLHPATNITEAPNKIAAFNVTSAEGVKLYRAAVQFLVERYTRPGSPHGLMTGMIIGNEVQSHWDWHNQGDAPLEEVVRDYHVAVRIADLIGRSLHEHFVTYISMDHRWERAANGFLPLRSMAGRRFLHEFTAASRNGGEFPWALAFHPYPEDLFEPSFWNDRRAPLALDAPVITFRNIEVLPKVMSQPQFLFRGTMRRIALTEQGFHRKDSAEGENAQAVALALGYRKISQLPEIDFFLLHRHQDHPHEGGLNLGLLDGKGRRTKAWSIYQSIDQPDWRKAAEAIVGTEALGEWAAAGLSPIRETGASTTRQDDAVFDFYANAANAQLTDAADFRPGDVEMNGQWKRAILHHPKGPKHPGRAKFAVTLPPSSDGQQVLLDFATAIDAPSHDGVGFRVNVNGAEVFSTDQRQRQAHAHQVDLTRFAGKPVSVELVVDAIGNTAHDLGAWIEPRIIVRSATSPTR